jgi:hypothetical protein
MEIPLSFRADQAEAARRLDPALADAYLEHLWIGDPLADAAMQALVDFDQATRHRLIEAGMERDEAALAAASDALREFFREMDRPPPFPFDEEKALAGSRAFYEYSDLFFVGMVLESLITGLSENLAKAFHITGRTAGNLRRVKQNTRHLVEITLPGGLDREGDGWKLTVRIRMIHAQIRYLLLRSGEWDTAVDGVPLNMAHMALAATGFSAINLQSVRKLGVRLNEEESAGFMHIWHYVQWLLGIPDALRFTTEDEALRIRAVSRLCEQPPGARATEVAHGYVNTVPELLGIEKPAKQRRLLNSLFRVSRALIGNERADRLGYPKQFTFGALGMVRLQRQLQMLRSRVLPGFKALAYENFAGMMQRSVYDDVGISYRMPSAVSDKTSSEW